MQIACVERNLPITHSAYQFKISPEKYEMQIITVADSNTDNRSCQ